MNPWFLAYLIGVAAWLVGNLSRVAKKITEGSLEYWPEASRRTRTFLFIAMFWNTVCAAVLWPGSLVLQLVGVVVSELDALDGDE